MRFAPVLVTLVTVSATASLACAGGMRRSAATPPPCTDTALLARAQAGQAIVRRTRPLELFLPPAPPPSRLRGQTAVVHLRVDSVGRPVTDRVTVTGIADSAYAARLRAAALRMRFVPAMLPDGDCAVSDTTTIEYSF